MRVWVVDNGSQWTHREWRVLRYLGQDTRIAPNDTPLAELRAGGLGRPGRRPPRGRGGAARAPPAEGARAPPHPPRLAGAGGACPGGPGPPGGGEPPGEGQEAVE